MQTDCLSMYAVFANRVILRYLIIMLSIELSKEVVFLKKLNGNTSKFSIKNSNRKKK